MRALRIGRFLTRFKLLIFVALAIPLYAFGPKPAPSTDLVRVSLSNREIEAAIREARRAKGSELTASERDAARESAIEDAVLEAEARRLGLERNDVVVRNRLVQKSLFIAEDLGGAFVTPTETDLRKFYDENAPAYLQPDRFSFVHVYVADPQKEEAVGRELAKQALSPNGTTEGAISPPNLGDPFPYPRSVDASMAEIAALYGQEFARTVGTLPLDGTYHSSTSKFGMHFVRMVRRTGSHQATYEEARPRLEFDVLVSRRREAIAKFYANALTHVVVDVEGSVVTPKPKPAPRLANRDPGSSEDGE